MPLDISAYHVIAVVIAISCLSLYMYMLSGSDGNQQGIDLFN
jgi:hypothetical protein